MPKSLVASITLGLLVLPGATLSTWGQSEIGTAQLSGAPNGSGAYDYTITLNNTGTVPIGTFWYAWIPGQFYLPTAPASATAPSGWGASIVANSIEFTASSSASYLTPGSSLDFHFVSTDTPSALAGDSPAYPGVPVGTSYLYSGAPFSDAGHEFVVQSVPEPSALLLLTTSFMGLLLAGCRKKHALATVAIRHANGCGPM